MVVHTRVYATSKCIKEFRKSELVTNIFTWEKRDKAYNYSNKKDINAKIDIIAVYIRHILALQFQIKHVKNVFSKTLNYISISASALS